LAVSGCAAAWPFAILAEKIDHFVESDVLAAVHLGKQVVVPV